MDHYQLQVSSQFVDQLKQILEFYEYKWDISISPRDNEITRYKQSKQIEYDNIESFLLNEVFYKKKKNLHYFPVPNPSNTVTNFEISPLDIIKSNDILVHLLDNPIFRAYLYRIHNYGTFFRFSENKVQRLYWNPGLNAGIPLTEKPKDPVYELIFLLHDFGHFLLPDLIFTGHLVDNKAKNIYVNWRLLGESITIVLNEMLGVAYLKDTDEFKNNLKMDYDKPYKLFTIVDVTDLKKLFWASYLYFCRSDPSGFLALINTEIKDYEIIWKEFDSRYSPVSARGREWTESNFDNLARMANDYTNWWKIGEQFQSELNFVTIEKYYEKLTSSVSEEIMKLLFEEIWKSVLDPLFNHPETFNDNLIPNEKRKILSFKRYILGNLLLLSRHQCDILPMIEKIKNISAHDICQIRETYVDCVKELWKSGKINLNEYHNYKNIYIMMPPNIINKDIYSK